MNTFDLEKKFSLFCDGVIYKGLGHRVEHITSKEEQEKYGDKKLFRTDGTKIYIDEKSSSYLHSDMVIEVEQDLETNNHGWWSKLIWCNALVYGYYDGEDKECPTIVYLVKWNELKKYIVDLHYNDAHKSPKYRTFKLDYTTKGFGITYNIYCPWKKLIEQKIVAKIYPTF